ncbi:MAG: choice-of-anchor J domain-containing protein [Prevotellaceae bacterium]|jgi:hypothetical protein|nr:choice-of-anchor J domain-containing protein [Prevotellaceae bacterium]
MKRVFLILLCAFAGYSVGAQSTSSPDRSQPAPGSRLLNENFDRASNAALPTGWQSMTNAGGAWVITNNIGASIPNIAPITPDSGSGQYAGINGYSNAGVPNDAWLFSRGMNMTAGKSYLIRFSAYAVGLFEAEQMDVHIGAEQTATGMTSLLWNSIDAGKTKIFNDLYAGDGDRWETFTVSFTPLYTGIYYLGFYDHSSYDGACLAAIDDVEVTEIYTHNLRLHIEAFSQIPVSQVAAAAKIENAGAVEQTNVVLNAELNGTPLGSASIPALAAGETSGELAIVAPTSPTGFNIGANTFTYAVTADQPEDTPDDNTATIPFTGTSVVYAYDNVTAFTDSYGSSTPVSFGMVFPIYNATALTAVGVGFTSAVQLPYSLSLYKMTGETTFDPTDLLATAATRTVAGMDWTPTPETPLQAGQRYFLTVNQLTDDNIAVAVDGTEGHVLYRRNAGTIVPVAGVGGVAVRMALKADACTVGVPANLNAVAANTSVTLTWDYVDTPFGYSITVESGTHTVTRLVTDATCTIDGLRPGATYNWSVRTMCDGQQGGTPANGLDFITTTPPCYTTLPWTEDFTGTTFPPDCWTTNRVQGTGSITWARNTTTSYNHSDPASAIRRNSSSTDGYQDDWLITRPLDIPAVGAELSFWWRMATSYTYDRVSVLISTSGTATADFTELWVAPNATATWTEAKIALPPTAANQTVYIAFRYEGLQAYTFIVDDISVEALPEYDAELVDITRPSGSVHSTPDEVTIIVKNTGGFPLSDIPVSYQIDGGATVNEVIPVTGLISGSTYQYTFTQTADLTDGNAHVITVTVNAPNDADASNNTRVKNIAAHCASAVTTFPWSEGFDYPGTFPPECWTKFALRGSASWNANTSTSASSFHNSRGSAYRNYSSSSSGFQDDWLVTKPIVLSATGTYTLSFWWKTSSMYSSSRNSVLISSSGLEESDFTELWTTTSASTSFKEQTFDLTPYAGNIIYVAFRYEGTYAHGWIVDDVSITWDPPQQSALDASVESLVRPVGNSHPLPETVEAVIQNNGTQTLYSIQAGYSVDAGAPVIETIDIPSGLATGATYSHTFATLVDLSGVGTYDLRVFTLLPNDEDTANDTLSTQIVTCGIATWPFSETFGVTSIIPPISPPFPPACWEINIADAGGSWTALTT